MSLGTAIAVGTGVLGIAGAAEDRKSVRTSRRSGERQRAESQAFIEKTIKQARGDLFKFTDLAQQSRRAGAQAGLDLFGQIIPQQLGAFREGNVGAQETLIQGLPQIQNALLGQATNLNFQPVEIGGGITIPQLPQAVSIGAE